jgi:uncharacterized SAM-binding protein YcdF (DUF218 family)
MKLSWSGAMFKDLLLTVLLPPGSPMLLIVVGLALGWRKRPGMKVAVFGLTLLWLSSTPLVGDALIHSLEAAPVPDEKLARDLGAIVVLGSNVIASSPELRQDITDLESLGRVRYAARLAKRTAAPILVTGGGQSQHPGVSEAEVMARDLKVDFGVDVKWLESGSNNTAESAQKCFALLQPDKRTRIALVTSAWHIPRAERAFRKAGFDVVPAPTVYIPRRELTWRDAFPGGLGLVRTQIALRELLGLVWYRLQGTA